MNEQEKYWGCTPVVTAHMEARMKASREYAKMVSNDDETPAQRADRAIAFECGAIWEEGTSKGGWRPASEHPPVDKETGFSELVVGIMPGDTVGFPQYVRYQKNEFYDRWIYGYTGVPSAINIKWWCYPQKEE